MTKRTRDILRRNKLIPPGLPDYLLRGKEMLGLSASRSMIMAGWIFHIEGEHMPRPRKLATGLRNAAKHRGKGKGQQAAGDKSGVSQASISLAENLDRAGAPSFKKAVQDGSLPYDLVKILPRLSKQRQAVWVRKLINAKQLEASPDVSQSASYKTLRRELIREVRGISPPAHGTVKDFLKECGKNDADTGFRMGVAAGVGFSFGYFDNRAALDATGGAQLLAVRNLPPPPRGSSRLPLIELLEALVARKDETGG